MTASFLHSLAAYSQFVAELLNRPFVERYHKHVPPNIKRNRIPAPGLGFEHPNLPQIVAEIEVLIAQPEENP